MQENIKIFVFFFCFIFIADAIIDASESGDPDNARSVIIAEWFCGRDGQLDGLNLDDLPEIIYPSVNPALYTEKLFPSEGCFSTSVGKGAKLSDKGLFTNNVNHLKFLKFLN